MIAGKLRVGRAPECFDSASWTRLGGRPDSEYPFSDPLWMRLWWETFGTSELYLLKASIKDETVGAVMPVVLDEEGTVRFAGGTELTDYCGPVLVDEQAAELAAASLLDWMVEEDLSTLDGRMVGPERHFADALADAAGAAGFECIVEDDESSAVLDLPAGWDEYTQKLERHWRHELRRKRNRFRAYFPEARVRSATAASLGRDLDTFFSLHRRASGAKGQFMTAEVTGFFKAAAEAYESRGSLRLDLLEADGHVLAATYAFQFGGAFRLYNSAYDPSASRHSPGIVLLAELIERAIAEGLQAFDFMRGSERYKYRLGCRERRLARIHCRRIGSAAGRRV